MTFYELTKVYKELEKTKSGNDMRKILSDYFKKNKKEVKIISYFTLGRIASEFEDLNMGVADKMVLKAITFASEENAESVQKMYKKLGDAGIVAENLIKEKRPLLKTKEVFEKLHKIARLSGKKSHESKIKILSELLRKATSQEANYITKIVLGILRLGVAEKTILDSLAIAFTGSKKNKDILEHAYNVCPDIGLIAEVLAKKGLAGVKKIDVVVGRPIQMMLAQRVIDIEQIKEKIRGSMGIEEKYDGERIQVHKQGNKIILYSRKLENITNQFPDVIKSIKKNVKVKSFVIEGEVVAVDKKGNLLPFQILMQRRRKYNIPEYIKKIPVCFYLFDLIYLNGKSFLEKSYPERRTALEKIVKETNNLQFAKRSLCQDMDCVEEFFNKSLERGCEGIIAKSCSQDSVYKAGTRGWLWIKWKREYSKEIADTFDLVIIGAFMGRGRRSGTYGAVLCATYNNKKDVFETICKLGSGFKDSDLKELPKKLNKYKTANKPARVEADEKMKPDTWFEPYVVVEVLGAEITRSQLHTCSIDKGKGLALRFPRFIRYREDKKPEQATTSNEINSFLHH